jgi:hypothetical protein
MYLQLNDIAVPGGDDGSVVALKSLLDAVTNGHVTSATVQAGGSGYAAGDIVRANTGTAISGWHAEWIVLTVSSGVVTAIARRSGGVYSTLPNQSTTGHATVALTGGGTGLTLNYVVEGPFTATAVVGGASYAVGDTIEVDGGTGGSVDPSFVVTSVSSGAVTGLAPLAMGNRTTPVDTTVTPAATTALTGTGNNALTVNYVQVGWRVINSTYTNGTTDFELWLKGTNISGAHPFVGLRTVTGANQFIELYMAEGYDTLGSYFTHPGGWTDIGTSQRLFIGTTASAAFSWFVYVSGRVINFVLSDDNSYELGVVGCFIPFTNTPQDTFPKPFIAGGTICDSANSSIAASWSTDPADTRSGHSSILHHMTDDFSSTILPPYRATNLIGIWAGFNKGGGEYLIWPWITFNALSNDVLAPQVGAHDTTPDNNGVTSLGLNDFTTSWFTDANTGAGTPGVSPIGASGQTHFMSPPVLVSDFSGDGSKVHGQLEGLAYIHGRGLNDEDRVTDLEGRRWIVLPDTVTNAVNGRFALLEG